MKIPQWQKTLLISMAIFSCEYPGLSFNFGLLISTIMAMCVYQSDHAYMQYQIITKHTHTHMHSGLKLGSISSVVRSYLFVMQSPFLRVFKDRISIRIFPWNSLRKFSVHVFARGIPSLFLMSSRLNYGQIPNDGIKSADICGELTDMEDIPGGGMRRQKTVRLADGMSRCFFSSYLYVRLVLKTFQWQHKIYSLER